MIVEPTPTNPRSPGRRALRVAGIAVPVVLLTGVIGAGLLGPRAEPPVADASADPAASTADLAPTVPARPPGIPDGPAPAFPAVAAELAVLSVPEAQPRLGAATGEPLAIAGWLGGVTPDEGCTTAEGDTRRLFSPLCERRARLLVADPDAPDAFAHIHVRVPPGVRLPEAFEARDAQDADPMPVVIVGRAESPGGDCLGTSRGCRERFTADRVAWADGKPFDPGAIFDAGLEVPPPAIAYRHRDEAERLVIGWSGTVLVSAVVRPVTVAAIDPDAGAALARAPRPDGLVWYARGLETTYGPARFPAGDYPPRVRWVVLDETTGLPLATGITGGPGATTSLDRAPSAVANLRVRRVTGVLALLADGRDPGFVAVTGYLRAWAEPAACPDPVPGLPGSGCARHAVLAADPWSSDGAGGTEPDGAHLHAVVPPGVTIPESAVELDGGPTAGVPVVVVGRAGGRGIGCDSGGAGCEAPFTVERVTWAAGSRLPVGRHVAVPLSVADDDPMADDLDGAAGRVLGPVTTLLRVALVDAADLRLLDATAARAVRAAGGHRGAVWYLRGLDVPYDPAVDPPDGRRPAMVRWAVVDAATGEVLAASDGAGRT